MSGVTNVFSQEKWHSPPAYEDTASPATIFPVTSANSARYMLTTRAKSMEFAIPAGPVTSGQPATFTALHSGWKEYTHPEGAAYYVNKSFAIPVVTDSRLRDEATLTAITAGLATFHNIVAKHEKLPPTVELYIRVLDEAKHECGYYLVDHDTQTEFWLEKVTTAHIGIEQASSEAHIRYALQEHYWTHVEYFPYRPVARDLRDELQGFLRHGQADHMTSRSSTFPYSVQECKGFLKLLNVSGAEAETPCHTCVVARLWSTVAKHRYDNLHGEACARLDRGQRVREPLEECNGIVLQTVSAPVFGMNKPIAQTLDNLYVDGMVYTMHWRNFMSKMLESWKDSRLLAIGLMIVGAILLVQPIGELSKCLGIAAIALSMATFISSIALVNKYHDAAEYTAAEAADALCDMQHARFQFHPIALAYSIPKALVTWSTIILATEVFSMIVEIAGLPMRIALIIVFSSLALFISLKLIIPQVKKLRSWTVWFRRDRRTISMV